jgi:Holliday junction resolvase RusA-like endonuclease
VTAIETFRTAAGDAPRSGSTITIVAYGVPGPQGSKAFKGSRPTKSGGRAPILVESSKKVKPWREAVTEAAQRTILALPYAQRLAFPFTAPLEMALVLTLPRPARMPAERVVAGVAYPMAYPDVSKLARSTEDALTGTVWADDAQVVRYTLLEKRYVGERYALDRPGAVITIAEIGCEP